MKKSIKSLLVVMGGLAISTQMLVKVEAHQQAHQWKRAHSGGLASSSQAPARPSITPQCRVALNKITGNRPFLQNCKDNISKYRIENIVKNGKINFDLMYERGGCARKDEIKVCFREGVAGKKGEDIGTIISTYRNHLAEHKGSTAPNVATASEDFENTIFHFFDTKYKQMGITREYIKSFPPYEGKASAHPAPMKRAPRAPMRPFNAPPTN